MSWKRLFKCCLIRKDRAFKRDNLKEYALILFNSLFVSILARFSAYLLVKISNLIKCNTPLGNLLLFLRYIIAIIIRNYLYFSNFPAQTLSLSFLSLQRWLASSKSRVFLISQFARIYASVLLFRATLSANLSMNRQYPGLESRGNTEGRSTSCVAEALPSLLHGPLLLLRNADFLSTLPLHGVLTLVGGKKEKKDTAVSIPCWPDW